MGGHGQHYQLERQTAAERLAVRPERFVGWLIANCW